MADENDECPEEPHVHMVGPFQFGPTPEQVEQARMRDAAFKHDLYRIFGELREDQLQSLRGLLHICAMPNGEGTSYAEHFEGIAVGVLHSKFGICISCNLNHDKEAEELAAKAATPDE